MAATPPPPGFDFSHPPFDLLGAHEQQWLARKLDLVLFAPGQRVIEQAEASAAVYVILKGEVVATDVEDGQETPFGDYRHGDLFGAFAAIAGRARHRYRAREETLCYAIPAEAFRELIAHNPRFSAYFLESMAVKKRLLRERDRPSDLAEVMLSRIRDGLVVAPVLLPAGQPVEAAVRAMRAARVDNVLVQFGAADSRLLADLGIVTRTDLLDALALKGASPADPVDAHARRPVIAVEDEALLFEALVTMTQKRIHRIVVTRGGEVRGTLGLMEVLSHFSAKSHLINFRLEQAQSSADLHAIAQEFTGLVRTLYAQGAKIRFLMDLISALNTRLLARLCELDPPPVPLTLLVLGSEGRHEQILKTDQDNALILPEGAADPVGFAEGYSAELQRMGFPPCPGGVMVRNPVWRRSEREWLRTVRQWTYAADGAAVMNLAILFDASVVYGPPEPLAVLKQAIHGLAGDRGAMARFAEPAVAFRTPLTLFGGLKEGEQGLDLKKGGIFPVVHGVRALALRHGIAPTNTYARIEALVAAERLHPDTGRDLAQALSVLIRLRLGEQLAALGRGEAAGNALKVDQLRRLDLDLLRDALRVVRDFQGQLRREFGLG